MAVVSSCREVLGSVHKRTQPQFLVAGIYLYPKRNSLFEIELLVRKTVIEK